MSTPTRSCRQLVTATLVAWLLCPAAASAQRTFNVEVTPIVLARTGDIAAMRYVVRVLPGSTDSLSTFLVDAPGTRLHVVEPAPSSSWTTMSHFRRRAAISWVLLENLTTAGAATPPLEVSGAGVLGIVRYWAVPETPAPTGETDTPDDTVTTSDTIVNFRNATVGTTIGIVRPSDLSAAALATRLGGLISQACALGWIDNDGVCNSLQVKARADANVLNALQNELDAQRGQHVSEQAYLLLSDNLAYLLTKL